MACKNCEKSKGYCKVCALLDGDETIKTVSFCSFCNVSICESCSTDIDRRFLAFKKARVGKLKENWKALKNKWNGKK